MQEHSSLVAAALGAAAVTEITQVVKKMKALATPNSHKLTVDQKYLGICPKYIN